MVRRAEDPQVRSVGARATVLARPKDVRIEDVTDARLIEPTDAMASVTRPFALPVVETDALMPSLLTLSDIMAPAIAWRSLRGRRRSERRRRRERRCRPVRRHRRQASRAEQIIIIGRHADRIAQRNADG